jgi:flagellar FliL protein
MSGAAAAVEEQVEGEPKKKGPLIKIIIMVVAVLVLIGGSVGGTLFATGFFSKKEKAEDTLEKLEAESKGEHGEEGHGAPAEHGGDAHGAPAEHGGDAHGEAKKDDGHGGGGHGDAKSDGPPLKELVTPDADNQRWKFNYYAMEKPLLSNIAGSRKVMQVTLTVMTHYDDRVIKNMKTHELALRAGVLDVMRQSTEADLAQPDFRKALAENVKLTINSLLEKYEGFGGIEEVLFTEFVVQ